MPLHGYTTDRRPPTNRDHMYAHPYAMGLACWQILGGSLSLLATLFNLNVSQSVQRMPEPLIASLGALLVVGGTQTMRGLFNDDDDLMCGWRIERTGLILSAVAWAAYTIAIVASFPAGVLSWTLGLVFAAVNVIRYRATVLEERRTRARIREASTG